MMTPGYSGAMAIALGGLSSFLPFSSCAKTDEIPSKETIIARTRGIKKISPSFTLFMRISPFHTSILVLWSFSLRCKGLASFIELEEARIKPDVSSLAQLLDFSRRKVEEIYRKIIPMSTLLTVSLSLR
jgi:hypothetical protein